MESKNATSDNPNNGYPFRFKQVWLDNECLNILNLIIWPNVLCNKASYQIIVDGWNFTLMLKTFSWPPH
jgi:hypothetical protein